MYKRPYLVEAVLFDCTATTGHIAQVQMMHQLPKPVPRRALWKKKNTEQAASTPVAFKTEQYMQTHEQNAQESPNFVGCDRLQFTYMYASLKSIAVCLASQKPIYKPVCISLENCHKMAKSYMLEIAI